MLNHGVLGGTGKMLILPVDQGFEHGPIQSFEKNPEAYDPSYHFKLAIEAGCSAYAAPLGFLEAVAKDYAGEIPLILKINNSDSLYKASEDPIPALTSSVEDALRLGCVAIGFTIYPGSTERKRMFEEISEKVREAKKVGLVVVIWAYPRGKGISKQGEVAVDVTAYAAHVAAQLGANIIKIKPSSSFIESPQVKSLFEERKISIESLSDRTGFVITSAFNGKRIVIFSGGAAKGKEEVLSEIKALAEGGSFGSIIGRNAFQRKKEEALKLFKDVFKIYLKASEAEKHQRQKNQVKD